LIRTFEPSYTKDGQDYPLNPRFEIYSGNLKKVGDYISLGSVSDSIIRKGMEANDFTMSAWIKIPSNITKIGIML
jgi:hypothetical protein